ncbi:phenylalanine--tRNA ligase subunit beta [Marinobacter nanhaiticus D15-8W]|uniref:Phenylalanine--tRNA ligase beta subunit n=1 Tax=Marinobacter nanhaiticus D15-8W TaxID=626887 RepID=N6X1G3_9GAMM|nr:phenylalanine--tRNA ligase subunit beta [Marinobacter nanhaiticus]ENO17242.1 phenylalanine--tRNA ligase subunit beta [Marinobacter nanhaiticus D15-8W]BES72109.1 phenylalanine--tRNA ligase subunit beta [Marinobacter nanhaiticus D15-8W]
MKFSEQWLREWVNPDIDTQALVDQITMAGLEVDEFERVAGSFSDVIVGEVLSVEQHPDADKLRVCQVAGGEETVQVVCGAPNVRAGLKVPFAVVGAVLPGNFKIKKAKLRGQPSNGMLCSESELQLSESHEGLMELPESAPVGKSLREYLGLDDVTIDVDLTPNRSDCLSIRGLAREVGVLNRLVVEGPDIRPVEPIHSELIDVRIDAPEGCPRYLGRIIRNVDLSAETPLWMRERLRRSGVRSIDPAVDVTNYVMLELGQPMHAFDRSEIVGGIVVRWAKAGEKLVLLDGQEVELTPETLIIADHDKPIAIAGVMGGEHSGVVENTRDLVLEAAFFDPISIAGKARHYGLHTDASHRFERGVDPKLTRDAMERATALLLEIVGGEAGEIVEVHSEAHLPQEPVIELREQRVADVLGLAIDRTEIEEILTRLGLHIDKLTRGGWKVHVPSFRPDITIEVDLIEEIGRIYGYNNLPVTEPVGSLGLREEKEAVRPLSGIRSFLVARGYQEAVTYSFVDEKVQSLIDVHNEGIELANPISSDMAVMRTSLWPGLLKTVAYNQNRQQSRIRLFETGLRFIRSGDEIDQVPMLSGVVTGPESPESWVNGRRNVDFYDVKGDLEALFDLLGIEVEFHAAEHAALHPGQCAELRLAGLRVGWVGALHPQVQKKLDLDGAIYMFELFLNSIVAGYVPNFKEFSKFPEVRRDLAIIIGNEVTYAEVQRIARQQAGEYLTGVRVFDVFEGEAIGEGRKSLALSLFWQHPERTLNDDEIQAWFNAVIDALKAELDATLRS